MGQCSLAGLTLAKIASICSFSLSAISISLLFFSTRAGVVEPVIGGIVDIPGRLGSALFQLMANWAGVYNGPYNCHEHGAVCMHSGATMSDPN